MLFTVLVRLRPSPAVCPIEVVGLEGTPRCEFTELGEVKARDRPLTKVDDLLPAIRKKAREMGGDAVLYQGMGDVYRDEKPQKEATAIVIRWKDGTECARELASFKSKVDTAQTGHSDV